MSKVFVAYSQKDVLFVERLAGDLKKAGMDVWYDLSGLGGGVQWRKEIENAIKESQFMLVVLSPDSATSEWVEREFLFASRMQVTVIPVLHRPCELPLHYLNLQYIDIKDDRKYEENFSKIVHALSVKPDKTTSPTIVKKKRRYSNWKPEYIAAVIGAAATLVAGLFPVFMRSNQGNPTPPVATGTYIAPLQKTDTPTNTALPVFTMTKAPTATGSLTDTPEPTQPARGYFDPNPDPIDYIQKFTPMRIVPEGTFTMGKNGYDKEEKPVHPVYLGTYYIDKYEVTNEQYSLCVDDGACNPPQQFNSRTHIKYYNDGAYLNHPVIYVDFDMAETYCQWRGARLPTEAEWEKAARGDKDERTFPWGEGIDGTRANYAQNVGDTSVVGTYKKGRSIYGVYDMAGNVWEWTADWYKADYYSELGDDPINPLGPSSGLFRVIRGGSWFYDGYVLRVSGRVKYGPSGINFDVGFRCALTLP